MAVCRECVLMLRAFSRPSRLRVAPINSQRSGPQLFSAVSYHTRTRSLREPLDCRDRFSHTRVLPLTFFRRINAGGDRASQDLNHLHNRIFELTSSALSLRDQALPSEQRVLYVLEQLAAVARSILDAKTIAGARQARAEQGATATSALLGSVNAGQYPAFLSNASLLNLISEKAEEILRHPNVFITPSILKDYVEIQAMLHQPSSLPDIFDLYASKPTPKHNGSTIKYEPVSPDKINAAVDSKVANKALTSAMTAHNLPLCMDIINSTFCTSAFRKSKILRQAVLPGSILSAVPVIAYGLSSQFSMIQTSMDPTYATGVAFAGIMTYFSTLCGLGYVVITTANDQMDRITWAKGVPLWERWTREEERAAFDRVAGKWGFQSLNKRGEEEGEEWESLREFVGVRGMALDKVELMEGME